MNNTLYSFESKEQLTKQLCTSIVKILKKSIDSNNQATLAVSGGSTPKPLFEMLSKEDIDWKKVVVTLVDERWVDQKHKDSNEKLVKENLLQNNAQDATFIPLKNDASTPFDGVKLCNKNLQTLENSLDVVILGMGLDGHTASFFPKDENLTEALTTKDKCAATIPTDAPHQRITLSLSEILKAKNIFLHIEGELKWKVYNEALKSGLTNDMPVRAILKDKKNLEVYYAK